MIDVAACAEQLTRWCPMLPYQYNCKASCDRPC